MDYFFYNTDADCLFEQPLPRFPRLIRNNFAAAGGDRRKYAEQLEQLKRDDILLMYENRVGVVAVGRVRETWDEETHTTPMYYSVAEFRKLDGGPYEYRIGVDWFLNLSEAPHSPVTVDELRSRFGYRTPWAPRRTIARIAQQEKVASMISGLCAARSGFPEEVSAPQQCVEGACCQIFVNAFERNPEARRRCVEHYGTSCCICGFSFGTVYGGEAEGYIHVHHVRPLSAIRAEYLVDPIEDLRPVCPNCHAILHLGGRCRSIEEVQQLVQR